MHRYLNFYSILRKVMKNFIFRLVEITKSFLSKFFLWLLITMNGWKNNRWSMLDWREGPQGRGLVRACRQEGEVRGVPAPGDRLVLVAGHHHARERAGEVALEISQHLETKMLHPGLETSAHLLPDYCHSWLREGSRHSVRTSHSSRRWCALGIAVLTWPGISN